MQLTARTIHRKPLRWGRPKRFCHRRIRAKGVRKWCCKPHTKDVLSSDLARKLLCPLTLVIHENVGAMPLLGTTLAALPVTDTLSRGGSLRGGKAR